MLGVKTYPDSYIASCRARIEATLDAYRMLQAPSAEFEATFFSSPVLVLDEMFVHRLRVVEGKDGNALNDVRVLCESMLLHGNVMTPEKTIKLAPDRSVLGCNTATTFSSPKRSSRGSPKPSSATSRPGSAKVRPRSLFSSVAPLQGRLC